MISKIFRFKALSHSWVATPEKSPSLGVIEFIGGEGLGMFPTIAYYRFLNALVDSGYTVIAVPFPLRFNHRAVAKHLKQERETIHSSSFELFFIHSANLGGSQPRL